MKLENIDDVRNYINSIPFINQGGCAISMLSIYRWSKNNNIKVNMVFGYVKNHSKYYINNQLSKIFKNNNILPPSHAFLFDDKKYFDCSDHLNKDEINDFFPYIQFVDETFVINCINKPNWNDSFDRNQILNIEKILNINLSDIKINMKMKHAKINKNYNT